MRRILLVALTFLSLTFISKANAVVIYDLALTGSVSGTGELQLSAPIDLVFQNFSPATLAPHVDLFKIVIGGQTFDLTSSFTNLQFIGGALWNVGVFAVQSGAILQTSGTTYVFNSATAANVVGQISAELREPAVAAVPEPATWAMMVLGFVVLAGAAYRKKRFALATLSDLKPHSGRFS